MEARSPDPQLVDTHYLRPEQAGAWLLEQDGRAAFVECNTSLAVPRLLAALEARGLPTEAVDWVFVTHVHLDHAGGAGALLRALPQARLVVHPAGAKHMIDPSRLIAGATAVYGPERMAALYGEILPVPAERVLTPEDGQVIPLAGRPLHTLHTPGHAWHHMAVHDPTHHGVFTGDVFGLAYPALSTPQGPFLFPTTAPTQLDPDAMLASIDRIEGLEPRRILLTHFGALAWDARLPADLRNFLSYWMGLARAAVQDHAPGPERQAALERQLRFTLRSHYDKLGGLADRATFDRWMELDIEINAQGLLHWAQKRA
jgi:glyoxylase-like metal-dependent hydrolase (beta-lactamase superfamily II)